MNSLCQMLANANAHSISNPSTIRKKWLKTIAPEDALHLLSNPAISQRMKRVRTKNIPNHSSCKNDTIENLKVNQIFTFSHKREYLWADSRPGTSDRILIFTNEHNLRLLQENNKIWYADGTFVILPPVFHQLYTIKAVVE